MRVTHDDGVELTFDNIVNDSSLYACDVLNQIESKKSICFGKSNCIGIFFSESECSSTNRKTKHKVYVVVADDCMKNVNKSCKISYTAMVREVIWNMYPGLHHYQKLISFSN